MICLLIYYFLAERHTIKCKKKIKKINKRRIQKDMDSIKDILKRISGVKDSKEPIEYGYKSIFNKIINNFLFSKVFENAPSKFKKFLKEILKH